MYTCVDLLEKPVACELETHRNEINVSQVSATLYTFMLKNSCKNNDFCRDHHVQKNLMVGALFLTHRRGVVMLQNVYKFPCTASSYFSCAHSCVRFASDLRQIWFRFGSVF